MKITQQIIRQIIKEELQVVLKENFPDEERFEKAFDFDYGEKYNRETGGTNTERFSLVILDSSDLKVPYPKLSGKNHGLASHAIKHAGELYGMGSALDKFKKKVLDLYNKGEDIYLRTREKPASPVVTYKINKNMPNSIQKYVQGLKKALQDAGYDSSKMSDPEYRKKWGQVQPQVIKKFEEENSNLVKEISSFIVGKPPKKLSLKAVEKIPVKMNELVKKIKNLTPVDFKAFLDFYHDMNRLDVIKAFGADFLVTQYNKVINRALKSGDHQEDPKEPGKIITKLPVMGGTVMVIRKKGKIASSRWNETD